MEHVAAEDILTSFTSAHEEVAITNTFLKICMDEPNVNWTFLEVFNKNQTTDVSAFFFFLRSCELWEIMVLWIHKAFIRLEN